MSKFNKIIGSSEFVKVDDKNRFYYMLQQMQIIDGKSHW